MFGFGHLNQDSLARIQNIVNGFRNYPAYSAYQIKSYLYDMHAGCHAIEISRNGQVIRIWWKWQNRFYCIIWRKSTRAL